MEYLVSSEEMKQYDTYTINEIGIPALVLMERAALAVVEALTSGEFNLQSVAVICGYGNNGGDGVAVARLLKLKSINVTLYFVGNPKNATESTERQIQIAKHYQVNPAKLPDDFAGYTTIVDAIFGVGLSRQVTDEYADVIEKINQSSADVLAIDMPSGISADSGDVMAIAVQAKQTVSFAYKKIGQVLYPGSEYCGTVTVADIGINDASFDGTLPTVYSYIRSDLPLLMPPRSNDSNKGTFGKVLVIAGSETMSGAAYLSAKAAYRTGAGLVKVYTPAANRSILLTQLPEAILTTYDPAQLEIETLITALEWATVIVIGPGMSTETSTKNILSEVLKHAKVPVIIDADGLNVLAKNIKQLFDRKQPIIITPHLGEMARLTSKTIEQISENLIQEAAEFARQHKLICVLKDARTIVATEQNPVYVNQSGNNGMSTAGAGDVLTGIIAGLVAQHYIPEIAATLGVYIHGLAGDCARQDKNEYSMIAEDIINGLTEVLKR